MKIMLKIAFGEQGILRLLNALRDENVREMRHYLRLGHPLPLLYRSGIRYVRKAVETWCDAITANAVGVEDCDGLSAYRAAELVAVGGKALTPGDGGYEQGRKLPSLPAEVYMTTRVPEGQTGLYHCVVRYKVGGKVYRDDPSARLGMRGPIARDPNGVPR